MAEESAARTPRRRRTAEEARREILEAARKRLAEGGPEAIRLQDIARDVGISHPAILHHFESREGLVHALSQSAMQALSEELRARLQAPDTATSEPDTAQSILERVFGALGDSGHARLFAWRALEGRASGAGGELEHLSALVAAVHARRSREARAAGRNPPSREDSAFVVRLTAAALLGDALAGPIFDAQSESEPGSEGDPQTRFRRWFAEVVNDHFERELLRRSATEPDAAADPPDETREPGR